MKTPKLYKECMGSLTSLPHSNFAVFTALSFVIACKELKIAQAAQINQIFQFNRELKQRRRRQQRERQKGNRFITQNNNFARASRAFFVHFLAVVARLQRERA